MRLSGYGVELAIKSTEYKAQDDTKVREEGSGDAGLQDQPDDVEGFLFSRLRWAGQLEVIVSGPKNGPEKYHDKK